MKNLAKFTILLYLILSSHVHNTLAAEVAPEPKGSIILQALLLAHQTIAHSASSHVINRQIPGSIVLINEKKYEIVSFIFEDPTGNLTDETFGEYAKKNNLFGMRTSIITPVKGITFEVFDSSNAHLDDGVYFYISLRTYSSTNEGE